MNEAHRHHEHQAGEEQRHGRRLCDPLHAAPLDDPSRFAYLAPDAIVAFVDARGTITIAHFVTSVVAKK